jgi:endonuclease/exonuclease/phosphatase family metal-dependent hydrolase
VNPPPPVAGGHDLTARRPIGYQASNGYRAEGMERMMTSDRYGFRVVRWMASLGIGLTVLIATGCRGQDPSPADGEAASSDDTTAAVTPHIDPPSERRDVADDEVDQPARTSTPTITRDAVIESGTFVARPDDSDVRLVTYNILWNNIFPDVSAQNAARFARVMTALDPDIVAMQEIGVTSWMRDRDPNVRDRTAADVAALMNEILPLGAGRTWHAHMAADDVIVSRWPLSMTAAATVPAGDREQALALVDLPDDRFAIDFYVLNNHYKSSSSSPEFERRRQRQSDSIVAWIRDARTPGGEIDLPEQTAFAIVGDLNIVQGFQPIQTLLDGDIIDEAQYGDDFALDWDGTGITDAHPRHNVTLDDDYTWRNDGGDYPPGRLDFVIYSDSVLEAVHKFVLNTTVMTPAALTEAGLAAHDVTVDRDGARFDHLPVVVDFRIKVPAGDG